MTKPNDEVNANSDNCWAFYNELVTVNTDENTLAVPNDVVIADTGLRIIYENFLPMLKSN